MAKREAVELLDPDAELVSVVTRGANRRGWRVLKKDHRADCDDCGLAVKAGNIEGLAEHFADQEHPFSACMDAMSGKYDEETAKAICGKVKALLGGSSSKADGDEMHEGDMQQPDIDDCVRKKVQAGMSEEAARAACEKRTPSEKGRMIRKVKGYIDTFVDMLRGLDARDPLLAKFENGDQPMHTLTLREQIEKTAKRDAITLSFNPALWDATRAIAFAQEHGFKADEVDTGATHIRLWQIEKASADADYADFATVLQDLPEGVACIVAKGAPKNPTAGSKKPAPHNPAAGHKAGAPHNEPWAYPNGVPSAKVSIQRSWPTARVGTGAPHNPTGKDPAPHNPTAGSAPAPHDPPDNVVLPKGKPAWNTSIRSLKGATVAKGGPGLAEACALLQGVLTTLQLDSTLSAEGRTQKTADELALFADLVAAIKTDESMHNELVGRAIAADALAQMPAEAVAQVGGEQPVELSITPLEGGQEDDMTKEQEAKLDAALAAVAKIEAAAAAPALDSAKIAEEVHKAVAEALGLKPADAAAEPEKSADEKLADNIAKAVKAALGDLPQNVQRVIKAATGSRSARLSDTPETFGARSTGMFDSAFPDPRFHSRRAS